MKTRDTLLLALLATTACGGDDEAEGLLFGESHVLAWAPEGRFDAIDAVPLEDGALVAWSVPTGLHVRRVNRAGQGIGATSWMLPRCQGGIDMATRGAHVLLACLRRPSQEADKNGQALLLTLDSDTRLVRSLPLGEAGLASQGIAVAVFGKTTHVAWHDADAEHAQIYRTELGPDGSPGELHIVSSLGSRTGAPSLALVENRVFAIWSEQWLDATGHMRSRISVHDGRGSPRRLAESTVSAPAPRLGSLSSGAWIAFRDIRGRSPRAGLYLQRLDHQLAPLGRPKRLGRADSEDGPTILHCGGGLMTAVPRSWGRNAIVASHYLTDDLRVIGGERQVYESERNYALGAGACLGDRLLVVAAEATGALGEPAALHATTLRLNAPPERAPGPS